VREALCILWPFTHKKLISFGFAVPSIGIEVNYSNFEDIHKWPTPTTSAQARSFHAIAIFHTRHTHNISTIVCLLDVPFVWDNATQHAFHDFKMKLHYTPLLVLPKVDYTDTKFVPIFAKCSIEKELVDFLPHDDVLSKEYKIGILDSSLRKWLFSKFLFGCNTPPPILHESTNMDFNKHTITMKKIHEGTRAIIQATRLNTKKKGRDKTLTMLPTHHHDNKMMRDIKLQGIQRPMCFQAKSIANPYTNAQTFDVVVRVHPFDQCKPCSRTVNASHMHTSLLRENI
jgi:hypothetical protein